jgi:hypothetical protein
MPYPANLVVALDLCLADLLQSFILTTQIFILTFGTDKRRELSLDPASTSIS